jgi:ketosteroid isomerase-like protein
MRQFLLLPLLSVALAGLAKDQGTIHTKVYPIPGAADGAVGEYETDGQLKVLDDFQKSNFLVDYDAAILANDKAAFDRMVADRAVYVAERFGKGQNQSKADFLASFGEKHVVSVAAHTRDHVRLRVFGDNTVVMTGNSTSALTYNGKPSQTSRLFAIVYMKLDGRWQCVVHSIMDYKGLL